MPRIPRPWVTYAIIALNVAMFAVELARGAGLMSLRPEVLVGLGGSMPVRTMHGEPWRLAASMFLHVGVLHLGMNMWCLYQGSIVELVYGRLGFVAIYVAAGVVGGLTSLVFGEVNIVTVGASGAVFGVFGAFGAFIALRRAVLPTEVWQRTARQLGTFLVLNLVIGFSVPSISMSSHVGGAIAGFLAGALLLGRLPKTAAEVEGEAAGEAPRASTRAPTWLALIVLTVGIAAGAVGPSLLPERDDPAAEVGRFEETEHAAVARWNAAAAAHQRDELDDAGFAKIIGEEILPPFQQARDRLRALRGVPERLASLLGKLDAYASARLVEWTTRRDAFAATDPAQRQALFARADKEAVETARLLALYNAAITDASSR